MDIVKFDKMQKNKEMITTSTTNLNAQATLALLLTTITMYTLLILI